MIHFFRSLLHSSETLKKLQFPKNTKLLIIHADDMGLSQSTNKACINALENGSINSGSIMMPCSFAAEMISYTKLNPTKDIGIHLTLTSEWAGHQWPPILGDQVPSLINSGGFLFETVEKLESKANLHDIEKEMRAQIEMALAMGLQPSHIDCHMFSAIANPEFLKIYIGLGHEYRLPILLNHTKTKKWFKYNLKHFVSDRELITDQLFIATPRNTKNGFHHYYSNLLQHLNPGLNCLLVHPAYDDEEMKLLTDGHYNYGSKWRQSDYDFFMSDECRDIIQENNIRLITWQEINERFGKVY